MATSLLGASMGVGTLTFVRTRGRLNPNSQKALSRHPLFMSSAAFMRSSRVLRTASRSMSSGFVGVGSSTGQIALRNAQQKSVTFSTSLTETAPRVLSLQRDFLRSVAWIKRAYGVQLPESVRGIGSRLRAVTPARARPEWALAASPCWRCRRCSHVTSHSLCFRARRRCARC